MSKKDKSKPSPFGLPSFNKEKKELDNMSERMNKNLSPENRKRIEEILRQQGEKNK